MEKILKTIFFIFLISALLPTYYAMAEHDWNSQGGRSLQEKGNAQEELKPPEKWKGLEEWKAREAQKRLEQWKAREAQKRLEEWKIQEERKKMREWKERNGWKGEKYPYYLGPRQGRYGERKIVRTEGEARTILLRYFSPQRATIGKIREKDWFFEAEIKDMHNSLIDRVIIDKRTGRIRSVY
jgi:hypothetical protein